MNHALRHWRVWVVTGAALAVAVTTFSLGQWQLRRAAQKQALQTAIERQVNQSVVDVKALIGEVNIVDTVHRQAELKGFWRPEHTVFLDNRPMVGKTGFLVVTPLVLDGTSQAILVQRGWVQRNFSDRAQLPVVTTPIGLVTVRGRIAPPPSKLYEFAGVQGGRIRQNIDIATFAAESALPLMSVSLLQTGAASEGLLRDWAPPNLGVDKHYGYAFQWFGLFGLVLVLFAWFQLFNPMRLKAREKDFTS